MQYLHFNRIKKRRVFYSSPRIMWGLSVLFLLLFSCNTTKYLDESKGERLLVANKIEFKSKKLGQSKAKLNYELSGLTKQKPNSKFLGLLTTGFRQRIWYKLPDVEQLPKDSTTKFQRWASKNLSEKPAIIDSNLTERTRINFQNHFQQKGYLKATCSAETEKIGAKKAKVLYTIDFGPLFEIDTVRFESRDSALFIELKPYLTNSFLKKGTPLSESIFTSEKTRLTKALKNNGYAYFVPNFIEYVGDSTGHKVNVLVNILPLSDTSYHKKYRFKRVSVYTNFTPDLSKMRAEKTVDSVYFSSSFDQFQIKPTVLRKTLAIKPGDYFSQDNLDLTNRNLNRLGVYRFVATLPVIDSLNPETLDLNVGLSSNKRLSLGGDVDLNTNNNSVVSSWLLGVAATGSFHNRNMFRGAEHLRTNLRYGIEFDLTQATGRLFNSQEISIQNALTIPRFKDYLNLYRGLSRIGVGGKKLIRPQFFKDLENLGETKIDLDYTYLDLFKYYTYNITHLSYGYTYRKNSLHQFAIKNLGLDILRPTEGERFDAIFGNNVAFKNSFGNQLFTGFLFRDFNYTYYGLPNSYGERWNFRFSTEVSGLEIQALNSMFNAFFADKSFNLNGVEFSRFIKTDIEGTYTRSFTKKLVAAVRLGAGFASNYGASDEVPYVKQFYIGGPNSLRAWRIREIGPGGYIDPNSPTKPPFYQSGSMRFETNAELRFPLFWWFNGAVFLDAGNVFILKKDSNRPQAELRWDSYKNLALNTGFGLRGDFDYFILRFDFGLPLRNPNNAENNRYWYYSKISQLALNDLNMNIAVGYPF